MTTKKKATKKQAKRVNIGLNGPVGGGVLASVHQPIPFPNALEEFDAALEKVKGLRGIILPSLTEEATANRARRLADAASQLQNAGWTLRESAYHEADK